MILFSQACSEVLFSQNKPAQSPLPPAKGLVFLKAISTEKQPKQICFHPKRSEFYVANMNDASGRGGRPLTPGSLQIFSLPEGRLLHREPARTAVECLTIGDTLLYTDMFRDELVFFDLRERQVQKRLSIKEQGIKNYPRSHFRFMPKIIALSPDRQRLAVSTWLGGVSFFSWPEGKLLFRTRKFCEHPRGLLYEGNAKLIVMCYGIPDGDGQIVLLNINENAKKKYKVQKRIVTKGSPRHIVRLNPTRALMSNLGLSRIYLFDTKNNKILRSLSVPGQPNTIALDPDKRTLYVSLRGKNRIALVDVAAWKVRRYYKTGAYPTGLAVSPDGKYLAVTNFHAANLYLFSIKR